MATVQEEVYACAAALLRLSPQNRPKSKAALATVCRRASASRPATKLAQAEVLQLFTALSCHFTCEGDLQLATVLGLPPRQKEQEPLPPQVSMWVSRIARDLKQPRMRQIFLRMSLRARCEWLAGRLTRNPLPTEEICSALESAGAIKVESGGGLSYSEPALKALQAAQPGSGPSEARLFPDELKVSCVVGLECLLKPLVKETPIFPKVMLKRLLDGALTNFTPTEFFAHSVASATMEWKNGRGTVQALIQVIGSAEDVAKLRPLLQAEAEAVQKVPMAGEARFELNECWLPSRLGREKWEADMCNHLDAFIEEVSEQHRHRSETIPRKGTLRVSCPEQREEEVRWLLDLICAAKPVATILCAVEGHNDEPTRFCNNARLEFEWTQIRGWATPGLLGHSLFTTKVRMSTAPWAERQQVLEKSVKSAVNRALKMAARDIEREEEEMKWDGFVEAPQLHRTCSSQQRADAAEGKVVMAEQKTDQAFERRHAHDLEVKHPSEGSPKFRAARVDLIEEKRLARAKKHAMSLRSRQIQGQRDARSSMLAGIADDD